MVPLRQDIREEGICPICQECLKEAVSTDCGHLFCRVCLARHLEETSASGVRSCPLCRKPCSEGVLGAGYTCRRHQKKVCWFCEESRHLLCMECRVSPEHKSHCELAIKNAISHYKERLNRRSRKLRKDTCELQRLRAQEEKKLQAVQFQVDCGTHRLEAELETQHQTRRQLEALSQQQPDQLEDVPAEMSRIFDISRAIVQLSRLVTDLERMARKLDANLLKDASDLLNRSATIPLTCIFMLLGQWKVQQNILNDFFVSRSTPEQLEAVYPNLEKRLDESLVQPSSADLTCSSLGHLISDSPQPPGFHSPNLSSLPLGLPSAPSVLPCPEHDPLSSSPQL
ncbi:Tripartite motif-containing protein 40 [Camelus dromedarius]|uniref:Tripartite motif-containing protein 40 n=1 Tax=Camelus dromedarius TaxID=9838 RepID=A0A5N4CR55_CAMDR|nr:Tripartite motif-containing protein 40 [Camelus dromedarius]